jgi:hypothetical protein
MSTSKDMQKALFGLLTKCIRERDDDTPFRLAEQEAELKKRKCADPELGTWIDGNDFPFLIETLMLSDAVFSEEYPEVKLPQEERMSFASALEAHCEGCARCGLKRAYDLEWQARVNRALAENREAVGQAIARAAGKK